MSFAQSGYIRSKKYKLVPPDGGWGYIICASVIMNISTTTTFVGFFGMIFNDFFIQINMASTNVTMVIGTFAVCMAISGFVTNALLKILSTRKLALCAAVLFNIGMFCMVFVKSVALIFIFQGVLPGIALGILYSLSMTLLNDYFVTKRLQAVGIVQTMIALTVMVAPMFIKWSLETYGFRGTLLIISAISMHNILGVLMMHPVKWHMKRVEIPIDSQDTYLHGIFLFKRTQSLIPRNSVFPRFPRKDLSSLASQNLEMQILLVHEKEKKKKKQKVPVVKLTDIERAVNKTPVNYENEDLSLEAKNNKGVMHIISSLIDVSLCKTFLLSFASIGPSLACFADSTYTLMLPQALYEVGWSQNDVAWVLSLLGFGDLAMRFMFIFFSKWLTKMGIQEIYILGLFVAFVVRLGYLWTRNFTATLIFVTIMGIARCVIMILVPLVVSDVVSPEQFTSAIGMFLLCSGVMNFILSSAIGAVTDLTNSYASAFYLLTSFYAIIVLFWSIELCYKRNKHKWSTQRANSSKSHRSNKK